MYKTQPPDRWADYSNFGKPIDEDKCRIIPIKLPLKEALLRNVDEDKWLTPSMLISKLAADGIDIGLIIDLTYTTRYYDPVDFAEQNVDYEKIFCEGHVIPKEDVVRAFCERIEQFQNDPANDGKYIAIHCTHGINRTGYLICRYLMYLGYNASTAIRTFAEARGHLIEREYYIEDLSAPSMESRTEKLRADLQAFYNQSVGGGGGFRGRGSRSRGPTYRGGFRGRGGFHSESGDYYQSSKYANNLGPPVAPDIHSKYYWARPEIFQQELELERRQKEAEKKKLSPKKSEEATKTEMKKEVKPPPSIKAGEGKQTRSSKPEPKPKQAVETPKRQIPPARKEVKSEPKSKPIGAEPKSTSDETPGDRRLVVPADETKSIKIIRAAEASISPKVTMTISQKFAAKYEEKLRTSGHGLDDLEEIDEDQHLIRDQRFDDYEDVSRERIQVEIPNRRGRGGFRSRRPSGYAYRNPRTNERHNVDGRYDHPVGDRQREWSPRPQRTETEHPRDVHTEFVSIRGRKRSFGDNHMHQRGGFTHRGGKRPRMSHDDANYDAGKRRTSFFDQTEFQRQGYYKPDTTSEHHRNEWDRRGPQATRKDTWNRNPDYYKPGSDSEHWRKDNTWSDYPNVYKTSSEVERKENWKQQADKRAYDQEKPVPNYYKPDARRHQDNWEEDKRLSDTKDYHREMYSQARNAQSGLLGHEPDARKPHYSNEQTRLVKDHYESAAAVPRRQSKPHDFEDELAARKRQEIYQRHEEHVRKRFPPAGHQTQISKSQEYPRKDYPLKEEYISPRHKEVVSQAKSYHDVHERKTKPPLIHSPKGPHPDEVKKKYKDVLSGNPGDRQTFFGNRNETNYYAPYKDSGFKRSPPLRAAPAPKPVNTDYKPVQQLNTKRTDPWNRNALAKYERSPDTPEQDRRFVVNRESPPIAMPREVIAAPSYDIPPPVQQTSHANVAAGSFMLAKPKPETMYDAYGNSGQKSSFAGQTISLKPSSVENPFAVYSFPTTAGGQQPQAAVQADALSSYDQVFYGKNIVPANVGMQQGTGISLASYPGFASQVTAPAPVANPSAFYATQTPDQSTFTGQSYY